MGKWLRTAGISRSLHASDAISGLDSGEFGRRLLLRRLMAYCIVLVFVCDIVANLCNCCNFFNSHCKCKYLCPERITIIIKNTIM